MPKILYKYASRSRPENFFRGLVNIVTNSRLDYHVLATFDTNDESMNNLDVRKRLDAFKNLTYIFGESKNKIDAINRDMEFAPQFDILINTSDDMLFIQEGFDEQIEKDFAGDYDKVLHYDDGSQGSNCMTMSIIGREYYNRDKYIYDPRFESLWTDVVEQEKAKIRGCYKYMGDGNVLFRHLHPSFGLSRYDAQYNKTESIEVRTRDYETYLIAKKEYDPENLFPIRPI